MLFYRAVPLVAFAFEGFLLFLVLRVRRKRAVHYLFSLFLGTMALWGVTIFGMRGSPTLEIAGVWEQIVLCNFVLIGYSFLLFTILFTRGSLSGRVIAAILVPAGLLVAISPTPLVLAGMQYRPCGLAPIIGPLWLLYVVGTNAPMLVSFYLLYHFRNTTTSADDRNRTLYVLAGMISAFIGATTDYVAAIGWLPQPGGIYGNIIFATLSTVAVVRHNLVDAQPYLRRGVAYALVSVTVVLPTIVIALILYRLLGMSEMLVWADVLLVLGAALGLHLVSRPFQQIVDRWFIGPRYDALRALQELSRTVAYTLDSHQLNVSLMETVVEAMGTKTVHLFLYSPEKGRLELAVSSRIDPGAYPVFGDDSPMVLWLRSAEGTWDREAQLQVPVLQGLSRSSQEAIAQLEGEVFIPLRAGGRLVGLLVVGRRTTRVPYGYEDMNSLLTACNQAAMVIENARLYSQERTMRQELQRQNEQKTEFLHQVAHELKTPLTAIISSSELLGEELSAPEASPTQRLIRNITHSSWSMDRRVSELLDFARMQTGTFTLKVRDLEVRPIVEQTASVLEVLFKNKDQSLKLEIPDSLPLMRADRDRFEQVLINLLSNANKFSPAGTDIVLRARADNNYLIVEVEDSAPTIGDREKAKLFEPYYRGEDADKRQRLPGLGLGLAISKHLVELHNGEMWVRSKPGKGNTFAFSIPAVLAGKDGVVSPESPDQAPST